MAGPTQPPAQDHHRMNLNNYVQHKFRSAKDLQLEQFSTGPQHAQRWTVIVYFRGVEYGRGEGSNKAAATELASEEALNALLESERGH